MGRRALGLGGNAIGQPWGFVSGYNIFPEALQLRQATLETGDIRSECHINHAPMRGRVNSRSGRPAPPASGFRLLTALLFAGCAGEELPNPVRDALLAAEPPSAGPSVALRFPSEEGQGVRIYRLPNLEPVPWRFQIDLTANSAVGFVESEGVVYLTSENGELLGLDLGSGRYWTVDTLVAQAVIGPTNVPLAIKLDSTVGIVSDRRLRLWSDTLPAIPGHLWGAASGRFVAVFESEEGLEMAVLHDEADRNTTALPRGRISASPWADLLTVVSGSVVTTLTTADGESDTYDLEKPIDAAGVSAAGHKIYVAASDGELVTVDRYTLRTLARGQLPGPITDMRTDRLGRYLLLHSATNDEIWIATSRGVETEEGASIDVSRISGSWGDDLPTVSTEGTVLLRQGDDVVTYDPVTATEAGRVTDAAADVWLTIVWDPRPPALQAVAAESGPTETSSGLLYYAQISSTSNEAWAQDLADRLRVGGVDAQVLRPGVEDDRYRVVLGPYPTRQEADDIGRRLGRAYFVFSIEDRAAADTTANSQ